MTSAAARPLVLLALATLAACAADPSPAEPAFDTAAAPLVADGNGAHLLVKRSQTRCFFDRSYCVGDLSQAITVLDRVTAGTLDEEWNFAFPRRVNVSDGTFGSGRFPDDVSLGDLVGGNNADRVSASFSGYIEIPAGTAPNTHSFTVGSDDGFRLRMFNGTQEAVSEFVSGRGFDWGVPGNGRRNTLVTTFPPEGGRFPFELTWFDATGNAGVEWVWKAGDHPDYQETGWDLVAREVLSSPDLRVSLTAERSSGGTGDLQGGDSVRWTGVLRNAGKTPVYPQEGADLPGGVRGSGIVFSTCLENNLEWIGFGTLPTGATTQTTTNGCRNRRAYIFFPGPLNPGEERTFTYETRVGGFGLVRICEQGWAMGSTTDRAGFGRNRVQRLTDDPTDSGGSDSGNARRTLDPNGNADDDQTCVRIGEPLPPFTFDTPADGESVIVSRPAPSGTARANARVFVTFTGPSNAATQCLATSAGDGRWSCQPERPLPDGAWTITAVVVDSSGNQGVSITHRVTITTPPPDAPVLDAVPSPTSDPFPRFTGTTAPFNVVTVTDGAGRALCTVESDASGRFTCASTVAFDEGTHTATARATDVSARTGPASTAVTFVVDFSGPPPPRFTRPTALTNERTPRFEGTAEAGAQVVIQRDNITIATVRADAAGNFSVLSSQPFADGSATVTAVAIDPLGNVGTPGTHTFTVDATAPLRPQLVALTPVVTDPTPLFSGTAEPGSVVRLRPRKVDGTFEAPLCEATTDASGNFSCRPSTAMADGAWVVEAEATDAAGNVSLACGPGGPCGNQVRFTIDDGPPLPPRFDSIGAVVSRLASLAGEAERGGQVNITTDTGTTVCSDVAEDGRFACDFPAFVDGTYTFVATVTDVLGQVSEATAISVTVDGTVPNTPTLDPIDERTNVRLQPFSGRAEPRSRVVILNGTESICEVAASILGSFRCVPTTPLADGTYVVTAVAIDLAQNRSAPSNTVTFILDATPPAAPVLTSLASPTPLATPAISGTAEAGTTIRVSAGGTLLCETTASPTGAFSCSPATLPDATYTITATATDAHGNTSPRSSPLVLEVDAAGPAKPVIDPPESPTRDRTPRISGKAEAGANVRVFEGNELFCNDSASRSGTWACDAAYELGDGPHVVNAVAIDALGRRSDPSEPATVVVDTTPPPAPEIADPAPGGRLTQLVSVAGSALDAAHVELTIDGAVVGQAVVADGKWMWVKPEETALLPIGTHTVFAVSIDAVENRGPPSETITFEVLGDPVMSGGGCGCGPGASANSVLGFVLALVMRRRRVRLPPPTASRAHPRSPRGCVTPSQQGRKRTPRGLPCETTAFPESRGAGRARSRRCRTS